MRLDFTIMEADSTTIENDCYEFYDSSEIEQESSLMDELLKYHGFYQQAVGPLLKHGRDAELLEWMKETNLIPPIVKCAKELPGCGMIWTSSRVVDKYQWQCNTCNQKVAIRENSFFKNLFCTLTISFKVILAWCQDVDFASVAVALGIKKQIVNNIYEKIERIVSSRATVRLGGAGSVLLVELYPDGIKDLSPDSSKNDIPKPHTKILCLADTKQVPTRYWLHPITEHILVQTENNNTKLKKVTICEEVMGVVEKMVKSGGYCAVGGGSPLVPLIEMLQNGQLFEGVTSLNNLISQTNTGMQSFMMCDIWKAAVTLCEAAQDLPRSKMQTYLSCCLWRREAEKGDIFQSLVQLIAEYDHSISTSKKHSKKKK